MNRTSRFATLACLASLLAGCAHAATDGAGADAATGPGNGGAPQSTAAAAAVVTASGATSVIYAVPAKDPHADGTLFLHVVGTDRAADVSLGQGTDAIAIPSVGSRNALAHMQWYNSASSNVSVERPAEDTTSVADAGVPLTSLEVAGLRYFQVGDSVVAVQDDATTATYPLPVLMPDKTAGDFPGGYKGLYSGVSAGTVSGLVAADSGDVLAFAFTGRAAAVTDLMTKETTQIAGYSRLGAAARDASGKIEVIAWKAQDESQDMQLLILDPVTLAVLSTVDLGVTPANHLRDYLLPGLGHDAVVAVAAGDETAGVSLSIWTVDGAALSAKASPPLNSGLAIAPADATSVYVYDGPGTNKVGQFDLASHAFVSDLPSLRAPAGSYVVGLLP